MITRTGTVFISIYDGDTEKNILRSGVLEALLSQEFIKIVLLIRSSKRLPYYESHFKSEKVEVVLLPPATSRFEVIYNHIGWNSIPTYSVYLRRHDGYLVHRNKLRYALERLLGLMGRLRLWRDFLRSFYYFVPDNYAPELFERYRPDLVFAPNMFSAEDCRLLKAAKKRGVKTVTTVKSWDVLTTKAFTRVLADRVMVFNEFNKREAIEIGEYREDQVLVTGFPQFDIYNRRSVIVSREKFFEKMGIPLDSSLILFAVPGDWKNPYTHEVMSGLDLEIDRGSLGKKVTVLARLHPKYSTKAEEVRDFRHTILDRPGTYFSAGKEKSLDTSLSQTLAWTFTEEDIEHLANSLYHCDMVINTESTMTLDAAAFDKPVVLIGFDGNQKLPYLESIVRNYDRNHYRYVLDTGGVRLAKSHKELVDLVKAYLDNPNLDSEGRKKLREKLLYKVDGLSSLRVANGIVEMLS